MVSTRAQARAEAANNQASASSHATTDDMSSPSEQGTGVELDVGDIVNLPGDMYGTVKFIGSIRGKDGRFVGIELDKAFAAKGKNNGDFNG